MKYYKVRKEANCIKTPLKNVKEYLIKNELITKTELKNMGFSSEQVNRYFDVVQEKPKNTFYFFGARFSNNHPYTEVREKTIF